MCIGLFKRFEPNVFGNTLAHYEKFFYVSCSFMTSSIMALHNILSILALNNVCPLTIHLISFADIHLHKHIRSFTRCFHLPLLH